MCGFCGSRRTLLASMAALGAAAMFPAPSRAAAPTGAPHRIDVHYHHVPRVWLEDENVAKVFPSITIDVARAWTPASAIEDMDRFGIATTVCSTANPGVWFGDVAHGRRLARQCNEYAAQMGRDYPGRFSSFAALPLPDLDGSLAELTYALDVLGAAGVGLFTTYGDKWIADPAFAPVFEELNRRKATVYVHPVASTTRSNPVPAIPSAVLEYPIETTRAIMDWISRGTSAKYPDVKVIFSHGGGLITAAVGRLRILIDSLEPLRKEFPENLKTSLGKLYFEVSNSTDPVTMAALRGTVPGSHILLGTDSPFGPMAPTIEQLESLQLPAAVMHAIERDNALALMPRLRTNTSHA